MIVFGNASPTIPPPRGDDDEQEGPDDVTDLIMVDGYECN
jgi:hypothetical protein